MDLTDFGRESKDIQVSAKRDYMQRKLDQLQTSYGFERRREIQIDPILPQLSHNNLVINTNKQKDEDDKKEQLDSFIGFKNYKDKNLKNLEFIANECTSKDIHKK